MGEAIKKEKDTYRCHKCGEENEIPRGSDASDYVCCKCDSRLARGKSGDDSALLGLVGGAALGAAVGGPVGAVIGGAIGAAIGKEAKGVG